MSEVLTSIFQRTDVGENKVTFKPQTKFPVNQHFLSALVMMSWKHALVADRLSAGSGVTMTMTLLNKIKAQVECAFMLGVLMSPWDLSKWLANALSKIIPLP